MSGKVLNFMFVVQGEGRGHMTQAISLRRILQNAGHNISCVMVGKSSRRSVPEFFFKKIGAPVYEFESPNFVFDKNHKSVRIRETVFFNLRKTSFYLKQMKEIEKRVEEYKPDILINFYDLLTGIYFLIKKTKVKYVCIGHQYLLEHPEFAFPPQRHLDRKMLQINTKITSFRAHKKLALSFREMKSDIKKKIVVVPPLLRKEVVDLKPQSNNYLLAYMVNPGYGEDIIKWHKQNPDVELHCFWDKKDAPEEYRPHPNLAFHRLNDTKFLQYMENCMAYVSTAGFESICEAMYLNKPVMVVPTEGHFEQECNALDAVISKAGISCIQFDISKLLNYAPLHKTEENNFKEWLQKADQTFIEELENV